MKKYYLLFIMLFIGACNESSKNIEMIDPSNEEYISIGFSDKYNPTPQISQLYNLPDSQKKKMKKAICGIKKQYKYFDHVKRKMFNYKLFVNEMGKIDKLLIVSSLHKSIDTYLLKEMKNWEMGVYEKEGKKHKYSILWAFELAEVKGDSLGVFYSTISVGEKISLEGLIGVHDKEGYFIAVDEMPTPIGGIKSIQEKIHYPEIAKRAGIQGRVFVKAFIDENGDVTKAEIIKGLGGGCDDEARSAVMGTKFTPGRQRGKAVKTQVTVPILFKLDTKLSEKTSKKDNDHSEEYYKKQASKLIGDKMEQLFKKLKNKNLSEDEEKKFKKEMQKYYGKTAKEIVKMSEKNK